MSMRSSVGVVAAVASVAVVVLAGSALQAAVAFPARLSNYVITTGDPTFVGANAAYDVFIGLTADAVTDTASFEFGFRSGFNSIRSFATTGTILGFPGPVNNLSLGTIAFDPAEFDPAGPFEGMIGVGYDTPAVEAPEGFAQSWLLRNELDGFHALSFNGGGTGLVTGVFNLRVAIPGLWTLGTTGPGSIVNFSINPAWTVGDLFGYDAVSDNTIFFAFNPNYDTDVRVDASLNFTLIGEVIPAPSAAALLALAGFCAARRRR